MCTSSSVGRFLLAKIATTIAQRYCFAACLDDWGHQLCALLRAFAQDHPERKIRVRVSPIYPDIARKMKLNGTVRVQVVISPNGNVKETKVIGGHPILVTAAVDAVKKWKFDPASAETTGILEIRFDPGN
jgi:TonB family protein